MRKRIFSILLTIAVCLSMMPAGVWANEGNIPEKGTDNLFKINTVEEFKTFQNKVNRGGTDKTVTLSTNSDENEISTENGHTNHCVCGGTADVNGHTHDNAGTVWTATTSLPDSAGSYYLTQSVSGSWTVPTGEVNLCLNGQTISGSITVGSGASLTLTDCSSDNSGKIQGGVTVNGGKFKLYSGTITGGVQVGMKGGNYQTGSAFTMYGGAITGNEVSSSSGGGVFLVGTTNHIDPPSFTMHGGTIFNNTAGASDGGGGGIYVGEKCSFTMDGGTITGNTATNGNGGGIYIHYNAGSVSISNATITDNKAPATGDLSYGHGGGIYSQRGVTVENVTITGNNSTFSGGGIYGKGAITLTDATVTDNSQYDVYYDGKESTTPELTVSGSVKAGYYANYDWKLPIHVSGTLSEDSVIRVGVFEENIKPGYGSKVTLAEPASGVTLRAENFESYAADCVTSLGDDGKVYLSLCDHVMDETGYTCKKCHTQFDARVGESAYYQTLTEAFSAVRDSTVTLLRDVTLTGNCSAAYNSPATLDLNGKTVSSEKYDIRVGGGNKPNTLTVKDSGTGGGTQALTVKFLVYSNGTLAVDNSYTGEISRVELQAGGALERFGGKIGELVLRDAAAGSTSTGYGLKLWKDNANACIIGKFNDSTTSKTITVSELLKKNHAKCKMYGKIGSKWLVLDDNSQIKNLICVAYKVQFPECEHQCSNDSDPVCSKCGKDLYTKITAKGTDGETKTAYFAADSALENGYTEAVQTLNNWSNEGCTGPTLILLRNMANGVTDLTLNGTLKLEGRTHTARNVTVDEDANVTFASGSYSGATINGMATVKEGVNFTTATVTIKGTLNVEGGTFAGPIKFENGSTANISGGSFTSSKTYGGVKFGYNVTGSISDGTFTYADFYTTAVKLTGGTFTKISTNGDRKLADLLAEGAAYYGATDNQAVTNDAVGTLENVKVVSHEHNVNEATGICSICKKQMTASLTVGGKTSWYAAFATAIEAANAADGKKTITLYQDVNGYVNGHSTTYKLTRGPVTLATGGKTVTRVNLIAKDISLTVTGSSGGFNVTVDGKDAELTVNDGNTKLAIVTAQNGGKLSLSNGNFGMMQVKDDGSSASLSGGTYETIKSETDDVRAYALLAKNYGYFVNKNKRWANVNEMNFDLENVTVEKGPDLDITVYPNSNENYQSSIFYAGANTSVTLTAKTDYSGSETLSYDWRYLDDSKKWITTDSLEDGKHTDNNNTLTISGLSEGTVYKYAVFVKTDSGYGCYSRPFTVSFTEPQIADVIAEATKAYDGTDAAELNNIKFFDASGNAIDIQESDFSIIDAKYTSSNAGTEKVKFTVKLNNSGYTFANDDGTKTEEKEFTCTVQGITKAAVSSDIKAGTIDITNGNNGEYSFDLKTILPELTKPCEYGEVTYSTPTVSTESEGYNATAKIEGTNIKLNISSTGSENGRIGNVTVNVKSDNYQDFTLTVNINAKDKIKPAPEGISAAEITYGQKLSESKLSGSMKDGNKKVAGTFSWNSPDTVPAGGTYNAEWTFTPDDENTYAKVTGNTEITVKLAELADVLAVQNGDLIYNGNEQTAKVTASAKAVNGMAVKFTYSTEENGSYSETVPGFTDAATYTVYYKAEAENHETVSGSFSVKINQKEITLIWNNTENRIYGDNKTVTAKAEELINNDDVNVTVSGGNETAAGDHTATAETLTGAKAENYKLPDNKTKDYTIAKASLTVKANDNTITYGDRPDNFGVTYNGFVNSENESVLKGTLTYDYSYKQFDDAGKTYTITPAGLTADNYEIKFISGNLTVNQKEITLNWDNVTGRVYKDGKAVSAAAEGIVNGDDVNVKVTNGDKAETGEYTATASLEGAKAGNYKLPDVNTKDYSIEKRVISIKVDDKEMTAGETMPELTVTYDNFADGDTADTVFENKPAPITKADGKRAGKFDITIEKPVLKTDMNKNYSVGEPEKGTLTVKAASSGGGGGGIVIPVQKPEITTGDGGKTDLSDNGTTIKITPDEGKEVDKVLVNGKDIGAVTEVKDLKPGDKVEVIFKDKIKEPTKEELDSKVKEALNDMTLKARSVKTSKKNIRINVIASITDKLPDGYTVKYKYYRSTKKTSGYRLMTAKSKNYYINTKGTKGTRYYYKARVAVYDNDGKLIAQTELKQCKYAARVWTKLSKSK